MPHYSDLNQAKIAVLRKALGEWKGEFRLKTAWDVGCGVGVYSAFLMECGFETRALDGREHNAAEAARRVPGLDVRTADVEDPAIAAFGSADLVFCLGLLYHLENPFRAVRNLSQITEKIMVIESMCTWDELPVLHLREERDFEDQGLRNIAFYPSESCLVKMLYRGGFAKVYRFAHLPDSAEFRGSGGQIRRRTMLVAARMEVPSSMLVPVGEPRADYDPWQTSGVRGISGRSTWKPWIRRLLGMARRVK
jgi:SAM-dependent methyltransferase